MTRAARTPALLTTLALAFALLLGVAPSPAAHAEVGAPSIASSTSATWTPWVRDGQVLAIAQVGQVVVLGGNFTSVSPPRSEVTTPRSSLVAFDAGTGEILSSFAPQLDGPVQALEPGPVPGTVYAGGSFQNVNGVARKSLVLLSLATGQPVTGWASPYMNGAVQDIARVGSRLVVAGTFTAIGKNLRNGLASFEPTKGTFDPWMTVSLTENNNWFPGSTGARAAVGAENIDVSPDGRTLVVIGNFRKADGLDRRQAVLLDVATTPSVRQDWRTSRFSAACSTGAFDSYVRDVDISPDGSYFVVATTGGPYPGTLCDTASRWNLADTGVDVAPVWSMDTGGDTLFTVAVTDSVVYAGGHQRWANNPDGRDSARGGAVPRAGIVAVDPGSGVPFSWNPGRNPRGIGTTALLANGAGLWVGSDTEWVGNFQHRRMRIALFPNASGTALPGDGRWALPASIYSGGGTGATATTPLVRRYLDGTRIDYTDQRATPGVDWTTVRGAFVVDGVLYTGASDGLLYRRSFDGTSTGPAELVDPYNDPYWSPLATGSGTSVYRGLRPSLYGTELASVSGMTFVSDRIVYTLTGSSRLYWRWFNPESGIVGQKRFEISGGTVPTDVRGLFAADDHLWYAHGTGQLTKHRLVGTSLSGTAQLVGGPTVDGVDWRGRALFPGPGTPPPANVAPQASWTVSCAQLACTFDASASNDPDGTAVTYSWSFGNGATSTSRIASHSFAQPGSYPVRLLVTDARGGSATSERSVTVSTGNVAPTASFTVACADLVCSLDAGASTDVDGTIATYTWTFGDGSTGSGQRVEHAYPGTGTYAVTLTVTDNRAAGGTAGRDVAVTAAPATIAYRGGSVAQASGTTVSTSVPAQAQAGDAMLLFATVNAATPTVTAPTGWTEVRRQVSGTMVTVLMSKVAQAGDAGSRVTVGLSASARTDLQLAVYSGTDGAAPVDSAVSGADISTSTHVTPAATVQGRSSYAVSYWADKASSSSATTWTLPTTVVPRATTTSTGSGRVTSALADDGAAVPAGTRVGGRVATTDVAGSRGTSWTVVLRPATG